MLGGYTKDYPYLISYCKIEAQGYFEIPKYIGIEHTTGDKAGKRTALSRRGLKKHLKMARKSLTDFAGSTNCNKGKKILMEIG